MTDPTREQARELYRTVQMLQSQVARRHSMRQRTIDGNAACVDLTFPQFNLLLVLRERREITIKDLAEALQVSSPSASAMVDRLVEMEMLVREQSKVDRREVLVRLSKRGEHDIAALENHILEEIADLLRRVGPEYARQWCEVYARIREVLVEGHAGIPRGAEGVAS